MKRAIVASSLLLALVFSAFSFQTNENLAKQRSLIYDRD